MKESNKHNYTIWCKEKSVFMSYNDCIASQSGDGSNCFWCGHYSTDAGSANDDNSSLFNRIHFLQHSKDGLSRKAQTLFKNLGHIKNSVIHKISTNF